jgi:hypothetical protein
MRKKMNLCRDMRTSLVVEREVVLLPLLLLPEILELRVMRRRRDMAVAN